MATVCYSCFHERTSEDGPCPHCGYDPEQDKEKYTHVLPHGTILAGMYVIGRVLGQGGFGITYAAQEHKSGKLVAVKEFYPDTMAQRGSSNAVIPYAGERGEDFAYGKTTFLEEAKTLAEFQENPNIVHVYTFFEENGTAYFAMEYAEGVSLQQYVKDHGGKIGWEEAKQLLLPVMDALISVHERGLIHRDIKPENIMITPDGTAKLLDFGSARYSLGEKSQSLDVVLTYGFSPLEQYSRHGRQGPYTDVYALAATLYYAVTGLVPPDSIDRKDKDDLVPLSKAGVKIPAQQEQALSAGLSVRPEDRIQTVASFRASLFEGRRSKKTILFAFKKHKASTPVRIAVRIVHIFCVLTLLFIGIAIIAVAVYCRIIQVTDKPYNDGVYTGKWSCNQPYDEGMLLYANGDCYTGEWQYGDMYGVGTMIYADGSVYEGDWTWGNREGTGTITYANGDHYEGEWSYDKKSGIGTMSWANGDHYEGEWSHDEKSGTGTMSWANGDSYKGEWISDMRFGTGTITWANGDWFTGNWSQDEMSTGNGAITYENGDHYEGEWLYDKKSGTGTMTWANGDWFTGNWSQDEMSTGNGVITYENGDHYEGEFSSGEKSGTGTMTYADGSRYEGDWRYDSRYGVGTYFYASDSIIDRIDANWRYDYIVDDGTSIATTKDGKVFKATVVNGEVQLQQYK